MSMGGGGDQTVTNEIKYTPEQKQAIQAAMPTLMSYMKNPPKIPDIQTVLPFNALQNQAQQGAVNQAMGPLMGFTQNMMGASQFLNSDALNPDTNPWLKATAQAAIRPISENLTQTVLPNVRSQSYADGFFGGSGQHTAESQAINLATRNMGDVTGKIYGDAYQQGMDNMVKNLALAPQTAQMSLFPWQVMEGVGGQQYSRDTAAAGDAFNRAMMAQQMPYLAAKDVLGVMMGMGTGSTSTTSGGGTSLGGILSGGMGGAATAGALGAMPGMSFMGGPWGMAAGAGLGALAAAFS